MFEKAAKERMLAGKAADPKANLPEGCKGEARDQAAAAMGVSGRSVQDAQDRLGSRRAGPPLCRHGRPHPYRRGHPERPATAGTKWNEWNTIKAKVCATFAPENESRQGKKRQDKARR